MPRNFSSKKLNQKIRLGLLFCALCFCGCATSPLVRGHLLSVKEKAVIIETGSDELQIIRSWWYIDMGDYTLLQTSSGVRHKVHGKWGSKGDSITVEVGIPQLIP